MPISTDLALKLIDENTASSQVIYSCLSGFLLVEKEKEDTQDHDIS